MSEKQKTNKRIVKTIKTNHRMVKKPNKAPLIIQTKINKHMARNTKTRFIKKEQQQKQINVCSKIQINARPTLSLTLMYKNQR